MRVDDLSPLLREALDLFPEDKRRALTEEELTRLSGGQYDPNLNTGALVVRVFDIRRPDGAKLGVRAVYARIPEGKQMMISYNNTITKADCLLVLAMSAGSALDSEVQFWNIEPPLLIDVLSDPGIGIRFRRETTRVGVSGMVVLIYEG